MNKLVSLKTLLIICCLQIVPACSNSKSDSEDVKKFYIDTSAFPKTKFYSVKLFSVNDSIRTLDEFALAEKGMYEQYPMIKIGLFFVDTLGNPLHKFFKPYTLDSLQINKLESFLIDSPCPDTMFSNTCFPVYRDVFVFYNEVNKPIAEAHICFGCEQGAFYPRSDYLCNFDNTVNFQALKKFTDSIKFGQR